MRFWGLVWRLAILVWSLWVMPAASWAADAAIEVKPEANVEPVAYDIWYEDGSKLSVSDISSPAWALKFKPVLPQSFGLGYSSKTIWLRVHLPNSKSQRELWYLEPSVERLQDVRLYASSPAGTWTEYVSGTIIPVSQRVLASRRVVFPVKIEPGGSQTFYYIRIRSQNAIMLRSRLWTPLGLHKFERQVDFINGIQFGALFLFVMYALALYLSMRELSFLHFCVMVTCFGMHDVALFQYGYEFLWPGWFGWNLCSPGIFAAISLYAVLQLYRALLLSKEKLPRWDRAVSYLSYFALAMIAGMLFVDYKTFAQVINVLIVVYAVITVFMAWSAIRIDVPGAKLMLLATMSSWAMAVMRVAQILKLLPADFLGDYSLSMVIVMSGILIVQVMLRKVELLRKEREEAHQQAQQAGFEARLVAERDVQRRTDELMLAKEVAEEKNRAKSTFLAHLSHELRTPLHSILGYSSLILDEKAADVDHRRVEAVHRSGRQLLALIEELMDYVRGEAGRLHLDLRPTYLRSLLESVIDEAGLLAKERQISLQMKTFGDLPPVVCIDDVRLRQILGNLISNACRHSGGSEVLLEVMGSRHDQLHQDALRLTFRVSDNGVGISQADRERIFLPFEQAVVKREGGMGLGLAIARQLVGMMGGDLACDSPSRGGAVFTFDVVVALAQEPALSQVVPRASRRYEGAPRRLLVVDDMPENRLLLADILATAGFNVVLAEGGERALVLLAEQPFDLMICDQLMPDIDGWALLNRARGLGCGTPFVLLSAAAPLPPADQPPGITFSAMLLKPCAPDRLLDEIGCLLGLEWEKHQQEAGAESLPRRDALPAPDELAWLRDAVADGRISDIEDWIDRLMGDDARLTPWLLNIREHLRRMDLAGISAMLPG